MLNEKRVKHMTQMSIYENKEAKHYTEVMNISHKDYVMLHAILGFIEGTLIYAMIVLLVMILLFSTVFENLNTVLIILFSLLILIGYVLFIYWHQQRVKKRASIHYKQARRKLKNVKEHWNQLEKLYEEEEQSKTPQALKSAGE